MVVVIPDGPELGAPIVNDMGAPVLGTPAIADGRLFVRTRKRLYCLSE
jgi:hypothetical protein